MRYQQGPDPRRAGEGGVERGAEPISAARGSYPEPCGDGQRLCASGAASTDPGGRSTGESDPDAASVGHTIEPAGVSSVRTESGGGRRRTRPAAGGKRGVPSTQGGPEFPRPAIATQVHRESNRGGPPRLHNRGA